MRAYKCFLGILLFLNAWAQTPAPKELDIDASMAWVDTGVDLRAADSVQFTATGSLTLAQGKTTGPGGASRGFRDLMKAYPVNAAGLGALIGRIGATDTAVPFLVGGTLQFMSPRTGRLFLGVNKTGQDQPLGTYHATITILTRGPDPSIPVNYKLPEVTQQMIDSFPRRITDAQNNAGDNTNFVVVGPEQKVIQTFKAAGWVVVDREKKDAVMHTILATLTKQAYVELPMSELMLFGRVQDYGLAHAEPIAVVAQRHHLRLWKAPFQAEGQEVWVGAATHDIGFDKDNRNNGVTHKIDPNVDDEREYVNRSLNDTGLVARVSYLMPNEPSKEAKTATGASFHSDGRMMVIHLIPASTAAVGNGADLKFANLFCSVREKENPDTGDWPACDQLLGIAPNARPDLAAISTKYRVLIIPGFFSACASATAPAFGDGQDHLRNQHKVTVETWIPPNDSSENNGTAIAQYLREHFQADKRKYIVIGYSKGAPDVQTALALNADAKDAVAAFISVAGAIGGSAVADAIPAQADQWINRYKIGQCQGDAAVAFRSLKRDVRRAFLAAHPNPLVPSYSLPAVSDKAHTSKMMLESWQLMSTLSSKHDSQLAYEDAIVPGSTVLGYAQADHLAVALPFDKSADAQIRSLVDKGRYPRAALLEALVRFVSSDLDAK